MARSFNGTTDKITIGAGFTGPGGGAFTVAGWVLPTNIGPAFQSMMAGSGTFTFDFQLTTGKVVAITRNAVTEIVHGVTVLSNNTWYHVAATWQGTGTSTGQIYINGSFDNSASANTDVSGSNQYIFGFNPVATDQFFPGSLANFAVWSVILTAGEFSSLGKGALPYTIRPSLLLGYWPLDGAQSPEPDLSGKADNGVLTGTAKAAGPPTMPFTPRWHRFLGWTPMLPASGLGWIINRRNKLMVPKKRA